VNGSGDDGKRALTQQEIDHLLDLYPFDPPRAPACAGFGCQGRPRTTPVDARYFPRRRRQGRTGFGLSVAEASALWHSHLDSLFLREMDLGPSQWVILWLLAVQGGEMKLRALEEASGLTGDELAAALAALEGRGFVRLLDQDRADAMAAVSDYSAIQRLIALSMEFRDRMLTGIGEGEISAAHATLLKVIENLREEAE